MAPMCTESVKVDCSRVFSKRRRNSIHMRDKPRVAGILWMIEHLTVKWSWIK